jgi:hypothetical protein
MSILRIAVVMLFILTSNLSALAFDSLDKQSNADIQKVDNPNALELLNSSHTSGFSLIGN